MPTEYMCRFQNFTPCVGGYALRAPLYLPPIPEWTIRVKAATPGQRPKAKTGAIVTRLYDDLDIYDITLENANWRDILYNDSASTVREISEVIGSNTPRVTDMHSAFKDQKSLVKITQLDTAGCTDMGAMFDGCISLQDVAKFDTSHVTDMRQMFNHNTSLPRLPAFDTPACVDMRDLCSTCSSLVEVPLLDTSSVIYIGYAFYACRAVESGALALYTQMSSQATPPSDHALTFRNCGADTTAGAAELAQIPSGWK